MPLLYETYSFSPGRVKDSELDLIVFAEVHLTCPVCGQTCFTSYEERDEHIKAAHPLHWHFWYAPHGKPVLALTGVSVVGLLVIGLNKAFPPPPRK